MSNIENSIKGPESSDKPLWEYILFIQRIGALWSLGEFFSGNPNSILSHMSSRLAGIEDLKSDLIFFAAPDIVNPNLQKFAWNLEILIFANCEKCQKNKGECILKHRAQVVLRWVVDYSRWPAGHERKISNARLNDLLRIAQSYIEICIIHKCVDTNTKFDTWIHYICTSANS